MKEKTNLTSHSVVVASFSNHNQLATAQPQQIVPLQLTFQELANGPLINRALRENSCNEVATPFLTQNMIEKIFKSPNFTFASSIERFSIEQTGNLQNKEDLKCADLFKSIILDAGEIKNKISAVGINYVQTLELDNNRINELIFSLTSGKTHKIDNKELKAADIKLRYGLNENCILNIQIARNQNGQPIFAFNAEAQINQESTLDWALGNDGYDFYSEYVKIKKGLGINA